MNRRAFMKRFSAGLAGVAVAPFAPPVPSWVDLGLAGVPYKWAKMTFILPRCLSAEEVRRASLFPRR